MFITACFRFSLTTSSYGALVYSNTLSALYCQPQPFISTPFNVILTELGSICIFLEHLNWLQSYHFTNNFTSSICNDCCWKTTDTMLCTIIHAFFCVSVYNTIDDICLCKIV